MITRVRTISSVTMFNGDDPDDSLKHIYIVRNELGNLGIINESDEVLLDYVYDSITPLGYGMWLLSKDRKIGLFRVDIKNKEVLVKYITPCKYDYYEQDKETVSFYSYNEEKGIDSRDVYIAPLDIIFENSNCDNLSEGDEINNWYFIDSMDEGFFINGKTGKKIKGEKDFYPASGPVTTDKGCYVTMCHIRDERYYLVLLYKDNRKWCRSEEFQNMPLYVYSPESDKLNRNIIGFIANEDGKDGMLSIYDDELIGMPLQDFARVSIKIMAFEHNSPDSCLKIEKYYYANRTSPILDILDFEDIV